MPFHHTFMSSDRLVSWQAGSQADLVTEILQYEEFWEETLPSTPTNEWGPEAWDVTLPSTPTQQYLEDWESA